MTNSTPLRFERPMLLTAFPPAPPTPTTVMRGFNSCSSSGMLRFRLICFLRSFFTLLSDPTARGGPKFLEIVTNPVSEPAHDAVRLLRQRATVPRDLGAFGQSEMHQPCRCGEGWPISRL